MPHPSDGARAPKKSVQPCCQRGVGTPPYAVAIKYGIDLGTFKTVPYTAKIPYPSDCFERMYGYLMIPTPSKLRGLKDIEFVHFSSL